MTKRREQAPITELLGAIQNKGIKPVDSNSLKETRSDETQPSITSTLDKQKIAHPSSKQSELLYVDPNEVENWEYPDRPETELGDLEALGQSMKTKQIQPCIVRPSLKPEFLYEVIAGERRWRAAKLLGIKLWVVVQDLKTEEALLCQADENKRENISDYGLGMHYARLIEQQLLQQKDLLKFGLSKVEINRLLAFSQIPNVVCEAISDMTKISSRTAVEIRSLANKGQDFIDALIALAPKLREGKMGEKRLKSAIDSMLNKTNKTSTDKREIEDTSGRHLFTWRNDSNKNISISFPKNVRQILDKEQLETVVKDEIKRQINEIDK